MTSPQTARLDDRGVLRISGDDARDYLQGLISNDIMKVATDHAIYAALLTPQGKYLFDFFIAEIDGALIFDCERARLADLAKRLTMYRLRSKVEIEDISETLAVAAIWGDGVAAKPVPGGVIYADPRLAAAGLRALLPIDAAAETLAGYGQPADAEAYDRHRLSLGLPASSRDLIVDKSILLEGGFDELNGVDWNKGCYVGQELTARTKYRGLIKKRLIPLQIDGPLPETGTPVMVGDKTAGETRSAAGDRVLALMRLEFLEAAEFTVGDATATPEKPDWVDF